MNSKSQNKFYKILDPRLCSSPLGPVVLAPDVEHEDTGDEQEGHHQDRHWPNLIQIIKLTVNISINNAFDDFHLNPWRIISVEPPHSSTASSSCPGSSLSSSSSTSSSLPGSGSIAPPCSRRPCTCSYTGAAGCWSRHVKQQLQSENINIGIAWGETDLRAVIMHRACGAIRPSLEDDNDQME